MSELLTRRRFTVAEYHRMGEVGILSEDNRLEVRREPQGDRYRDERVLTRGERVSPEAFPDLSLDVAELVG